MIEDVSFDNDRGTVTYMRDGKWVTKPIRKVPLDDLEQMPEWAKRKIVAAIMSGIPAKKP